MAKKLTKKETLDRFYKKHGNVYDYSLITEHNYANYLAPVPIICSKHGVFYQTPRLHAMGSGCPICCRNVKLTKDSFVKRAEQIHGDKYDYSKVDYINSKKHVVITCLKHGDFRQTPSRHLLGCGCPLCEKEMRKNRPNYKQRKPLQGVGILDIDTSTHIDNATAKAYNAWSAMILRCYTKKSSLREKYSAYLGCYVCDEWLYFSNFKHWFDKNHIEGYALDKDILVKGNKVYSPQTCCFVPQKINNIFSSHKRKRGKYPIGVIKVVCGNKIMYRAQMSYISPNGKRKNKILGVFNTISDAFTAYKQEKEQYIKDSAKDYYNKGLIDSVVYKALMEYEISIND